jgi:hypothetical protein
MLVGSVCWGGLRLRPRSSQHSSPYCPPPRSRCCWESFTRLDKARTRSCRPMQHTANAKPSNARGAPGWPVRQTWQLAQKERARGGLKGWFVKPPNDLISVGEPSAPRLPIRITSGLNRCKEKISRRGDGGRGRMTSADNGGDYLSAAGGCPSMAGRFPRHSINPAFSAASDSLLSRARGTKSSTRAFSAACTAAME